jgi:hypothetical protein
LTIKSLALDSFTGQFMRGAFTIKRWPLTSIRQIREIGNLMLINTKKPFGKGEGTPM